MSKLYFSINKDECGKLCDRIFYSKTKTSAKNELRDKGLTPKLVLSWTDVEKIKSDQFQNGDLTEEYRRYVLSHEKVWNDTKNKIELA